VVHVAVEIPYIWNLGSWSPVTAVPTQRHTSCWFVSMEIALMLSLSQAKASFDVWRVARPAGTTAGTTRMDRSKWTVVASRRDPPTRQMTNDLYLTTIHWTNSELLANHHSLNKLLTITQLAFTGWIVNYCLATFHWMKYELQW